MLNFYICQAWIRLSIWVQKGAKFWKLLRVGLGKGTEYLHIQKHVILCRVQCFPKNIIVYLKLLWARVN